MVQARRGDLIAARAHATEAVSLAFENGDPIDAALFRNYLAAVVHAEGNLDEAEALYRQSLADTRRLDFALGEALSLDGIAAVARVRGDLPTARRLYHDALARGSRPRTAGKAGGDAPAVSPSYATLLTVGG